MSSPGPLLPEGIGKDNSVHLRNCNMYEYIPDLHHYIAKPGHVHSTDTRIAALECTYSVYAKFDKISPILDMETLVNIQ